jgi:galactose oxidase
MTDAHRDAFVYDLNRAKVTLDRVGYMHHPRIFCTAVVLPTGDVVVAGGQTKGRKFSNNGGVLQAELWSPVDNEFRLLAPMKVPRTYHSTCILMKDARLACMGGGL